MPLPRIFVSSGSPCILLLCHHNSPPGDLELVDGALAVVVVDEVLVTHPNALVVHSDAPGSQVGDNAVQEVVDISHGLPGPEGHVHLAVVLKELRLALAPLEAQRVEVRALVGSDGHLLFEHTHLQLGKPGFPLHGSQLGYLDDPLQVVFVIWH